MPGFKSVFVQELTEVSTVLRDQLGDIRWAGNDVYKYVKLANVTATVAVVAGDPVAYLLAGYDDHIVVSDISDSQGNPVGAGIMQAACAGVAGTDYYIWIKIKGAATIIENFAGVPVDGDAMKMSTTDKTLTVASAEDSPIIGYIDDDGLQLFICDFPF